MAKPTKHDLYSVSPWRRFTAARRTLPDFLILGAQKAGTTTIYDNLVKHPDVFPSDIKEVHFFDRNWQKGQGWYRAHFDWESSRAKAVKQGSQWITGEGSPYYLFHPAVPTRVKSLVPEAKLLVVLRNPVDRAYSHYQHEKRKDRDPLSFAEALQAEDGRLTGEAEKLLSDPEYQSFAYQHYSYKARGLYARQLEAWFKLFPREQFLIMDSSALNRDFTATFGKIHEFLGLQGHTLEQPRRSNVGSYDKMDAQLKQELQDYFAPHNRDLEDLLGRKFDW